MTLALGGAAMALLVPPSAHAIDPLCAAKLGRSGCTQATELQGCDINKTNAQNARAGFGAAAAPAGGTLAPAAAIKACSKFANEGYDGTIVSPSAMKAGWWEVVMRFEKYRYVCNASSNGKVGSFDKLN